VVILSHASCRRRDDHVYCFVIVESLSSLFTPIRCFPH